MDPLHSWTKQQHSERHSWLTVLLFLQISLAIMSMKTGIHFHHTHLAVLFNSRHPD